MGKVGKGSCSWGSDEVLGTILKILSGGRERYLYFLYLDRHLLL